MQFVEFIACGPTGAALPYATAAVYLTGTTTPAAIYDINGNIIVNPATAGPSGLIGFSAANGTYDIQITSADGSYSAPLMQAVQVVDAAALATQVTTLAASSLVAGAVSYATLAALNADLAHGAGVLGFVYADSTGTNNGVYAKTGSSGSGSWVFTGLAITTPIHLANLGSDVTASLLTALFEQTALRYAYGKPIAAGIQDAAHRIGLTVTTDGYAYAKFAIRAGAVANGLTFTQDATGFWNIGLGTVQGQIPLGTAGDNIDTTRLGYTGGQQVLFGVADSANRLGLALTADGYLRAKFGITLGIHNGLSFTRSAQTGLYTLSLGTTENILPLGAAGDAIDTTGTRYAYGKQIYRAILDATGRGALFVAGDGTVYIPKLVISSLATLAQIADFQNYYYTTSVIGVKTQITQTTKATGATSQITSSGNNINPVPSFDQSKLVYTSDRNGGSTEYWQPVPATGVEYPVIASPNFVLIGDSRVLAYGPTFAALYPSRITDNEGVSGQDSFSIAARFGATLTTLVVSGNSIPASGPVTLSAITPNLFYHWNYSTGAIHGSISGIAGVLSYNSGALAFTPDTTGSVTTVPNPATFVPDGATVQNSLSVSGAATLATLQTYTAILGPGYNDLAEVYLYGIGSYSQSATLASFAALIAALKPFVKHFVVLGVFIGEGILVSGGGGLSAGQSSLGISPGQSASASMYNGITALNAALAAAYPNNFVDLQAAFVAAGYSESATINGVSGCTIINSTALTDGIHPGTAGSNTLSAAIQSFLTTKGW